MAITSPDVKMWDWLKSRELLPSNPRVLQIGEANWFGDVPFLDDKTSPFEKAREFYKLTLDYREMAAVDLQGPTAHNYDLNKPLPFMGQFDIVINSGTTEHVFDQAQCLKSIHDCTYLGGLIIHSVPHWLQHHGFYNYNPCLFDDLGNANGYQKIYGRVEGFMGGEVLCLAYRKVLDQAFRAPMQSSLGLCQ